MVEVYVDADACPVKDEVVRVTGRHGLKVYIVSNGGIRPNSDPRVETIIVPAGPDIADDWIAERAGPGDVVITNDIPLADRCLKAGARALRPNGEAFTQDNIAQTLATRDLMTSLRETGQITGGPRAFGKTDRSQFLNALEVEIQKAARA